MTLTRTEQQAIRIWALAHVHPEKRRQLMRDIANNPTAKHHYIKTAGATATTRNGEIVHVRPTHQSTEHVQTDEQELARLYELAERANAAARQALHNAHDLAEAIGIAAIAAIYGSDATKKICTRRGIKITEQVIGEPIERLAPPWTNRTRDLTIMKGQPCDSGTDSTPSKSDTTSSGQTCTHSHP